MKSTRRFEEKREKEQKYPFLGYWKGGQLSREEFVILFTEPNVGTVVWVGEEDNTWSLGEHNNKWVMEEFSPIKDKVILEN